MQRLRLTIDLRRSLRKSFRSLGFQRRIAPTFVDVMHSRGVDVVLDVGANDGGFGREIRDAGYRGRIVSFEPNPAVYERLAAHAAKDGLWDAFQLGLGDVEGNLELSVSAKDVFSSFKKPSDYGQTNFPGTAEARTESVRVVRLDRFLGENPQYLSRTYLKVDTQGFEMEVVKGVGSSLSDLAAVQLELGLLRIYADQEDWLDTIGWLRERGFEVATIVCNAADITKGQIVELDTVFVQRPV